MTVKKLSSTVDHHGCDGAPAVNLNLNVRGLAPSATIAINERSNALIAGGRRIFKMGLGQSPFPVPDLVVDALRENAHQKDYLPVRGLPALRTAVSEHHRRTFGIDCEPEDVMIGPGSKELMFLLQLVFYGDILIPTPAWVSYAPQAHIIGRQIRFIDTSADSGWKLSPEQLDAICREDPLRPRLLILNYPSNPTGETYDMEALGAIADIARKYRVIILSDEIYARLHFSGQHHSIVPLYPEGTIFSGGLSKWCGAGGWRLGLFVFPGCLRWLLDAMAAVASETFTSTSAPIQYAAVSAFQAHPELDAYLYGSTRILGAIGNRLAGILTEAGARVPQPRGGFYLFPDFGPCLDRRKADGFAGSREFCERLLEDTGVALLPGVDFGRPASEFTARLAYVNFDGVRALQAVMARPADQPVDDRFLQQYCPEPLEAVQRLCDWLDTIRW